MFEQMTAEGLVNQERFNNLENDGKKEIVSIAPLSSELWDFAPADPSLTIRHFLNKVDASESEIKITEQVENEVSRAGCVSVSLSHSPQGAIDKYNVTPPSGENTLSRRYTNLTRTIRPKRQDGKNRFRNDRSH